MTQDVESNDLVSKIRTVYGADILALRNALMGKTGVYHSRQAVWGWLKYTGIPTKYRRAVRKVLRERELREVE